MNNMQLFSILILIYIRGRQSAVCGCICPPNDYVRPIIVHVYSYTKYYSSASPVTCVALKAYQNSWRGLPAKLIACPDLDTTAENWTCILLDIKLCCS